MRVSTSPNQGHQRTSLGDCRCWICRFSFGRVAASFGAMIKKGTLGCRPLSQAEQGKSGSDQGTILAIQGNDREVGLWCTSCLKGPWCDPFSIEADSAKGWMARLRLDDRVRVGAYWEGIGGLRVERADAVGLRRTNGVSLKNLDTRCGHLKREAAIGHRARCGRYHLRPTASPRTT